MDGLFAIETNQATEWRPANDPTALAVAKTYGLVFPQRLMQACKNNTGSTLYRLEHPGGTHVLRSAPVAEAVMLRDQCRVLMSIPCASMLSPLVSHGEAVVLAGERAWLAYAWKEGVPFDGRHPDVAVNACALALSRLGSCDKGMFPGLRTCVHDVRAMESLVASLDDLCGPVDPNQDDVAPIRNRLMRWRAVLEGAMLDAVKACRERDRIQIVHNDLQHANLLVGSDGAITILDIEDIVMEDVRISASHALFKILRHAIYTGALSCEAIRATVLPSGLAALAGAGLDIRSFRRFGLLRIVSDLARIKAATEAGNMSLRYDWWKKWSNLLEMLVFTEEINEFAV